MALDPIHSNHTMTGDLYTPYTVYGHVIPVGDIHMGSYFQFLSRKFDAYQGIQIFCLRESFGDQESFEDMVDAATLVVGVVPSNDIGQLQVQAGHLRAAMKKEGYPTSPPPQFVCGVDCWQACMDDDSSDDDEDYDEDKDSEGKSDDEEGGKEDM